MEEKIFAFVFREGIGKLPFFWWWRMKGRKEICTPTIFGSESFADHHNLL
jgi:hypothetical protein